MSEIEIGEYVRTKNGYIIKVDKKTVIFDMGYAEQYVDMETTRYGFPCEEEIANHNKQLIDLIEEGDYVNGELITDKWDTRISSIRSNFNEEDIQTILTKESYMANCYKVGGNNEI